MEGFGLLRVLCGFLDKYISLVRNHIVGTGSQTVSDIDETRCSDSEERKSYQGIVPVHRAEGPIHFGVAHQIKDQMMLVCINTANETLCSLAASTDPHFVSFETGLKRELISKFTSTEVRTQI
jgi:hypothetical protein